MNGRLSTEQRAAAEANANHLLILASPGCGKTEVLAHRAAHLIHQLLPNQRILALTFTNRAKVNLSQRFRETLGATRMRKYVVVKNFHGHAADTILAHGRTLPDRPDRMSLPTRSTAGKDLERVVPDTSERAAAVDLLGQVKSSPLSDDEIITRLQDSDDPGAASALEVEQIRQEAMRLDYDDLLRHAQRILRVSAVARLYQCHFGAILVDEFQDMSLQHLDLVRRTCTASRTYAGDPDQGIFTWAGAAPKQVLKALREECSEPLRLHGSYRSSPQVLSMVNEISAHLSS
ncbi:MAG: UvrD-helicase domain-containing protein, partial [Actinomycetia bacterium]|nr:UvrD-helicase domain-containing protein [Actinomycetes bacterium]